MATTKLNWSTWNICFKYDFLERKKTSIITCLIPFLENVCAVICLFSIYPALTCSLLGGEVNSLTLQTVLWVSRSVTLCPTCAVWDWVQGQQHLHVSNASVGALCSCRPGLYSNVVLTISAICPKSTCKTQPSSWDTCLDWVRTRFLQGLFNVVHKNTRTLTYRPQHLSVYPLQSLNNQCCYSYQNQDAAILSWISNDWSHSDVMC